MSTRILVLANSYKHPGRCLAGVDDNDNWIRPVSDSDGGAITHSLHLGGRRVDPIDSLELDLGEAVPLDYQSENILLKTGDIRRVTPHGANSLSQRLSHIAADVPEFAQTPRSFISHGEYDDGLSPRSLALIQADQVSIVWRTNFRGVLRPRISFDSAAGGWTRLSYTGEQWEGFPPREEGAHAVYGASYVTLSVGQPLDSGEHYVLAAGVIAPL